VSGNLVTDGNGNSTVYLQAGTVADVLKAIDLATGVQTAANASGTPRLSTASGQDRLVDRQQRHAEDQHGHAQVICHHRHRQHAERARLAGNTGHNTAFTAARARPAPAASAARP
jgi:hypothetical protein